MITITYQGIEGSYTAQALENLTNMYNIQCNKVGDENLLDDFFEDISQDTLTLLPIESSVSGNIFDKTKLFLLHDIKIIAETYLDIKHCLICSNNCKDREIVKGKTILSHVRTLKQCSEFIKKHSLIPKKYNDTAGAIKHIVENNNETSYAIGPEFAVHLYGGRVLQRLIQNKEENKIRFLLIKKSDSIYDFESNLPTKDKSSLIINLKNEVGQLYEVLKIFKELNIDVKRIESQPTSKKNFNYVFILDIKANLEKEKYNVIFEKLKPLCKNIKFLGSYPSWKF